MAENEELEVDEEKKKGGGNKLIIIIAAALLGLSIGAAGVFFLVGGDSAETAEVENAEPEVVRSIYHRFETPFTVSPLSEGKQRYLEVRVAVKTKQQEAIDMIVANEPIIRSKLDDLFANQQLRTLQTDLGREALIQSATAVVQDFLVSKDETLVVEQVLFNKFIMQ